MLLGPTTRIWYVAYGSNLLAARFACYLSGGRPAGCAAHLPRLPGPAARPAGTSESSPAGQLAFAGSSSVWGGGLAFLRPRRGAERRRPAPTW